MLQLQSLRNQLTALRIAFDNEIQHGKTFEEVKNTYLQIKDVERLIYQRKIELKRSGKYEED